MKKRLSYDVIKNDIKSIKDYLNKTASKNWREEFYRLGTLGLPQLNETEIKEIDLALRDLIAIRNNNEEFFKSTDLRINNLWSELLKSKEPFFVLNQWIIKEKIPKFFLDDFFGTLESGLYYFFKEYEINVSIEILKKEKIEIYIDELQEWPLKIKKEFEEIEEMYDQEKWDKIALSCHQIYDKLVKKIFEINNISYKSKEIINILFPWTSSLTQEWLANVYKIIPEIRNVFKNWEKPDPKDNVLTKALYAEIKENPKFYSRIYIDFSKMIFNTILLSEKTKK